MALYHCPPTETPTPVTVVVPSRSPSRDSHPIVVLPDAQRTEERGHSRSRSPMRIFIQAPPHEEKGRSRSRSPMRYTRIIIQAPSDMSPPQVNGTQEVEERGRSRSRSPMRYPPIIVQAPHIPPPQVNVNGTQEVEERGRSRSHSPMQYPGRPTIIRCPSSRSASPYRSPFICQPSLPFIPPRPMVDILTYCYKNQMAYAPAGQTYEDALSCAQDVFPDLKLVPNDRISFHVTGVDQIVRIPKMSWQTVMQDVRRYEVVHVVVEDVPPPPQYQGRRLGCLFFRSGRESSSSNAKNQPGGFWARLRGAL